MSVPPQALGGRLESKELVHEYLKQVIEYLKQVMGAAMTCTAGATAACILLAGTPGDASKQWRLVGILSAACDSGVHPLGGC
jgi:hypothetical protein